MAAGLGLLASGGGSVALSWPRDVVVVISKPIASLAPPWTYQDDSRRFDGFVARPICGAGGVATCTTLSDGAVKIEAPRPWRPMVLESLDVAERARELPSWRRERLGFTLEPAEGADGLLDELERLSVVSVVYHEIVYRTKYWSVDGPGSYHTRVWRCKPDPADDPCRKPTGAASYIPDALVDHVADVTVHECPCWLGTCRVVMLGLTDADLAAPSLNEALESEQVHLVLSLPTAAANQLVVGAGWSVERVTDAMLWAVPKPDARAAGRMACLRAHIGPELLRAHDLEALVQPLPLGSPIVAWQDLPSAPATAGCGEILTHPIWKDVAASLGAPRVLAPADEARTRRAGDYEISVLALVPTPNHDSTSLLAEDVPAWFGPADAGGVARRVAALEGPLDPALSAVLDAMLDHVVVLGAPRTHHVVHDRVRGWDRSQHAIEPDLLSLQGRPSRLEGASLLTGAVVCAAGVGGLLAHRRAERRLTALANRHHDLAQPVATLLAYADLLADAAPEQAEGVRGAGQQMRELVDALGRATRDRQEPPARTRRPLAGDVVHAAVEAAGARARSSGVPWRAEVQGPNVAVGTPPAVLRAALDNLLDNALKFRLPDTEAHVVVTIRSGERVTIEVTDSGRGVADDIPEQGFEQASRGTNAGDVAGSGQGLSGTAEALRRFGGTLRLTHRSRPTTFCLEIPHARHP